MRVLLFSGLSFILSALSAGEPLLAQELMSTATQISLTSESQHLRDDVTAGNIHQVMERTVNMALLTQGGETAKKAEARLADINGRRPPLPGELNPELTGWLVPMLDQLDQYINAAQPLAAREQLNKMLLSMGPMLKQASENSRSKLDLGTRQFFDLKDSLRNSLNVNDIDRSATLAKELHDALAERRGRKEFIGSYGPSLYSINEAFGRAAIAKHDYEAATDYLLKQTKIPPEQMTIESSSGPNLLLAQSLLSAGYRAPVLKLLEATKRFWVKDNERLDNWIADILAGKTPQMKPNSNVNYSNW
jgi:hypothetical protein